MAITNKGIPGFDGIEMTILKAYIYRKHWGYEDRKTGEVFEGDKYLTLFSIVPSVEFKDRIPLIDNYPQSIGTFIKIIGSAENLIITPYRISLANYQNHLEMHGWQFVQTVPGAKGSDYQSVQKHAYSIIKSLDKARKEVKSAYIKKESVNQFLHLIKEKLGPETTVLPYLKQIENIINE